MEYTDLLLCDLDRCHDLDQLSMTLRGEYNDVHGHSSVIYELPMRMAASQFAAEWCREMLKSYCTRHRFSFKYVTDPILLEYRVRDHRDLMPSIMDKDDLDIKATLFLNVTDTIASVGGQLTVHGFGGDTHCGIKSIGNGLIIPAFFPYEIEPVSSGRMLLLRSVAIGKVWG